MGEKLLPQILVTLMEYQSSMSLKDVLNKLEKLELIPSALRWKEYRELRNVLTHEYPDNENEVLEGMKLAIDAFLEIKTIYEKFSKRFFHK